MLWLALVLAQTPPPLVPVDGAVTQNAACKQGSAEACASVADGEVEVARDALTAACAAGSVPSCEAGRAVAPDRPWKSGSEGADELPANLDRARKSLVRACEVGRSVACEAAAGLMVLAGRKHFASELRMHAVALKKGGTPPAPTWLNPGSTVTYSGESAVEVKQVADPDLDAEEGTPWQRKLRRVAGLLLCPADDITAIDLSRGEVQLVGCSRRVRCKRPAGDAPFEDCTQPY